MKNKILIVIKIIKEYGFVWCINRSLYVLKLKLLKMCKNAWKLFEHKENVTRLDIFDIDVKLLEQFYSKLDKNLIKNIINDADDAINGKIKSFSALQLNYGDPINYNYNPITNKYVSYEKKWFQIEDFNDDIGDIKIIWEPSRFCYFYLFSRAYMITKDIKYYEAFSKHVQNWTDQNTYPNGVNYKCGQECAIRMINLLSNFSVFNKYGLTSKEDKKNIISIIKSSYKKLLSNFFYAEKCIKNNHTLSELVGLMIGAWCENDKRRIIKYYKKFEMQIDKQFFSDGGYMQYSFNYQRLALQLFELLYSIKEKLGIRFNQETIDKLNNSVKQLFNLQVENGDIPNYGSNDGALIFPVCSSDYRDFSSTVNTINIFNNGSMLYNNYIYNEEGIWFGIKKLEKINIEQMKRTSAKYENIGLYSLRDKNKYMMIVCNNFKSRPSHMDNMHFDLWINGKNILCDSGSYSYANGYDKIYATEEGHNVIKIDNLSQAKKIGKFLTYDWSKALINECNNSLFDGIMFSKSGYSHRKRVELTDNKYIVSDIVKTKSAHKSCTLNLHTNYGVKICENSVQIMDDEGKKYLIAFKDSDITIKLEKTKTSPYYYFAKLANKIIIEKYMENNECTLNYEIMEEK